MSKQIPADINFAIAKGTLDFFRGSFFRSILSIPNLQSHNIDANPLENISNTQKIDAVIINAKLLQRRDLDKLLKPAEEAAIK